MPSTQDKNSPVSVREQKRRIARLAHDRHLSEAKILCMQLCDRIPDDPEVWSLLGAVHGELAEFPEAETCCRKALVMAPENPVAAFNLAVILIDSGKEAESKNYLETAIKHRPGFTAAYSKLAEAQVKAGNFLAAIKNYRKVLALEPDSAITCFNLANTFRELNQPDEATTFYKKSIQLKPDFFDAYTELEAILHRQSRFTEIVQILLPAAGNFPNADTYHFKLAQALQELGESDIALKYYEKAFELNKDNLDAWRGIAGILGLQGKYDQAGEHLENIIDAHPDYLAATIMYAEFAQQLDKTDAAIKLVTGKLGERDYSKHSASALHFSLAHLYESKLDTDLAFQHYAQANHLKQSKYDFKSYEAFYHDVATAFSTERMGRLARAGNESTVPVFIIGMPRSGTSLVEQILASHPDVYGAGELRVISNIAGSLPDILGTRIPYIYNLDDIEKEELERCADAYLEDLSRRSDGAAVVTDKMPFNFIHLGLIDLLFNKARIIHCVRDPLDTCLSCYFANFSGELPYTNDLADIGYYYNIYHKLMSHWGRVIKLPIHEIRYETLVLNQEAETRRLLEFCRLEWSDTCLQFEKTERTVSTASHGQVRRPLNTGSIGKWRNYEKYLDPLFAALNSTRQ